MPCTTALGISEDKGCSDTQSSWHAGVSWLAYKDNILATYTFLIKVKSVFDELCCLGVFWASDVPETSTVRELSGRKTAYR